MVGSRDLLMDRANVVGTVFHGGGHALASIVTGGGVTQIMITSANSRGGRP
ncbi:hypothetical protein QRX50_35525 [Amycolatopsis carbonis]|uniref:Uncharacterized protein n=1 Tax=Amycolatopsis carbonis TaxID=715471 RepID=A0A9Y2MVH0_9PSEU|nr:M50 family metallopeptidase [Amycolatopsis sp. 2-15]WIX76722.1 hypothetical protein QRX50_35525 [Amycolatopsis sp. 2-15]